MSKLWQFLGAGPAFAGQEEAIRAVVDHNRDAAWQGTKAGDFANRIPKGQSGSWQEFFSDRDKQIFKELAGETLLKWEYDLEG
jgi:hypothetical protein